MGGNCLGVHIHHACESEPFLSACSSLIILCFVDHRSLPLDATNMFAHWAEQAVWILRMSAKALKKPFSTTTFFRNYKNACFSSVSLHKPSLVRETGESSGAG